MNSQFILWGYVSPESIVPLASALSALTGGLLLFGHRLQAALALFWRKRIKPEGVAARKDIET